MRFLGGALIAVAIAPIFGEVVTTDLFIVAEGEVLTEDVYVAAQSGTVEGTIDGDLTIVGGDLTISGTVTGSVNALSAASVSITETGRVDGALRATGRTVDVAGAVGEDVAVTAISTTVEAGGEVGRDLVAFAGRLDISGSVGRDVRGRIFSAAVSGTVGNDVDVTVSRLSITAAASIGGDVLYRSSGEAAIDDEASIGGQLIRLPASGNFLYGIILTVANVVSLLAFLVIGCVALWLFRGTSARAVDAALRRPVRSLIAGVVVVVAVPVLVVLFAVTLVGLPLALALVFLMIIGLVLGPVPFVTAVGDRILRSRGGLFAAFLLGAVLWRLGVWFIPWIGGFVFLVGLVWGIGAWLVGAWSQRAAAGGGADLLPAAMRVEDELPDDWEFPLPPLPPPRPEAPAAPEAVEAEPSAQPDLGSRMAAITGSPADAHPQATNGDEEPSPDDDWGLPAR